MRFDWMHEQKDFTLTGDNTKSLLFHKWVTLT